MEKEEEIARLKENIKHGEEDNDNPLQALANMSMKKRLKELKEKEKDIFIDKETGETFHKGVYVGTEKEKAIIDNLNNERVATLVEKEFNSAGKEIKKLMNDLEAGKLKEFSLSDLISQGAKGKYVYTKFIKEFIKRLLDALDRDYESGTIGLLEYRRRREEINKLAGDKFR